MSQSSYAVVIPVFDEETSVQRLLDRVARQKPDEILVVDDGSRDRSRDRIDAWVTRNGRSNTRVFAHEDNRGKGAAIRTALPHVQSPILIIQDADLEYSPEDFPNVVRPIAEGRADVVYGSRYSVGHRFPIISGQRFDAAAGYWAVCILNYVVWRLYGLRTTDEATCYKAIRTDLLRGFLLQSERFEFCAEVTAKTARCDLRFLEIPISYHRRTKRQGKKIKARDMWIALRTLWRYRHWDAPQPTHSRLTCTKKLQSDSKQRRAGPLHVG